MLKRQGLLTAISFLFMVHGMLYFFSPDDVHNPDSPYKYIKYVLVLVFILLSIRENGVPKILYFMCIIVLLPYYLEINSMGNVVNFIGYVLPVYFLFSRRAIESIDWKSVISYTFIVCSVLGYYEIFFLNNHFYMYNASKLEYRLVSIFINPNNLGITMALLTFAYIFNYSRSTTTSAVYFFNGLLIVFLSVSKTGLGLFALLTCYLLYKRIKRGKIKVSFSLKHMIYLLAALPIVVFAVVKFITDFDFSKIRELSWETLIIRLQGNQYFLDLARENWFFPWINSPRELDNMYLHLWGSFGLPALIVFLAFNFFLILVIRSERVMIFLICFLVMGLTTNFLYLWPLAYIYWGLVSIALARQPINDSNEVAWPVYNRVQA